MIGEHRKKHHFNLIDIFLILVIVLSIVGVTLRSQLEDSFVAEPMQLEITCQALDLPTTGDGTPLDKNTPLYLADGTLFGICQAFDPDANKLVIHCTATAGDSVYLVNTTKISENRTLQLHSSLLSFDALVLNISSKN